MRRRQLAEAAEKRQKEVGWVYRHFINNNGRVSQILALNAKIFLTNLGNPANDNLIKSLKHLFKPFYPSVSKKIVLGGLRMINLNFSEEEMLRRGEGWSGFQIPPRWGKLKLLASLQPVDNFTSQHTNRASWNATYFKRY